MTDKQTRSNFLRMVMISLLVLIGLILINETSYSQDIPASTWADPVTFDRTGWFPDIATDESGRIHVAWSNSVIVSKKGSTVREGYDVVLHTSSKNGVDWETINEIAARKEVVTGNVEVTRPAMLIDANGIFHMTFRDMFIYYSQAPVQAASTAQYWRKEQLLATANMGYFSRLAIDSENRLHVVTTEQVYSSDCLICYHLFYRNSTDGGKTWSSELDISPIPTGAAKPQIIIDPQDNIHVVWEAGRGGTLGYLTDPTMVMYTVSYNHGNSWAPPLEFQAPAPPPTGVITAQNRPVAVQSKNVTIGRDGLGNLVVVWWSLPEDIPYFVVSADNGLSWTEPTKLPNVWGAWQNYQVRQDDYSMATDSAGKVHLVMVGRLSFADLSLRLLHLTWDGTAWSAPEAIVSYNGDVPEWPRIAISNGNQLNVVWFVRGEDFVWSAAGDIYKIWYTRKVADAPYVSPRMYPTFVPPTPTPLPTEVIEPTATPSVDGPKLEGTVVVTVTGNETGDEMDQLMIVGRSVLPALAVVVLLLAVILVRRR